MHSGQSAIAISNTDMTLLAIVNKRALQGNTFSTYNYKDVYILAKMSLYWQRCLYIDKDVYILTKMFVYILTKMSIDWQKCL